MTTKLMKVIRTETRAGFNDDDVPIHRHVQLFTADGHLIVELCDVPECDTLEPPEATL